MKVHSVTVRHVVLPMKFAFVTAKGRLARRDTIIITVTGETGVKGYGEVVAFTTPFYTAETVETAWQVLTCRVGPSLPGYELAYPEQVADDMAERIGDEACPMTTAGLENALLDAYYRESGQPMVATFLGESLRNTVASGVVIGDMDKRGVLTKVRSEVLRGCRRIKLKINPKDAVERVRLVRQAFPQLQLAVDANRSFTASQWPLLQALAPYELACIEEPLDGDVALLGRLRRQYPLGTPVCLDESVQSPAELQRADEVGALDVLNIKIGRLGGLANVKKVIAYCRSHHIAFWIGSMVESGISKILHIQLAALGDTYMPGDLSDSARYFERDVICPDIAFREGYMQVPNGIGSGVAVDDALLIRHTQRWMTFTR